MSDFNLTEDVVARVINALQGKYSDNLEYNAELDSNPEVEVQDIHGNKASYQPSEVLFWVDRSAYEDGLATFGERSVELHHSDAIEAIQQDDQESTFEDLCTAIHRHRISPFIGAGVSKGHEYPLWSEFLGTVLSKINPGNSEDIQRLIEDNGLIDAAELLYAADPQRFGNLIRTTFRPRPCAANGEDLVGVFDIARDIAQGCIVTTNFDCLIEESFAKVSRALKGYMHGTQIGNNFTERSLRGEIGILKLHGTHDHDASYVITRSQYEEAYGSGRFDYRSPLPKTLRQLYISQSFLFLGCSLEQDRTLALFKNVKDSGDFDIPDHFALLPRPQLAEKNEKESRLLELRIHPIWYDVQPEHDHCLVEKILRYAVHRASVIKASEL